MSEEVEIIDNTKRINTDNPIQFLSCLQTKDAKWSHWTDGPWPAHLQPITKITRLTNAEYRNNCEDNLSVVAVEFSRDGDLIYSIWLAHWNSGKLEVGDDG